MPNKVTLTFAGDSKDAVKAAKQVSAATEDVTKSTTEATKAASDAAKGNSDYLGKVDKLGSAVTGATDAFDSLGGAMSAVVDIQNAGRERAQRLARAQNDVSQALADQEQAAVDARQATEDLAQAQLDGKQAAVDSTQAVIDRKQAQLDADTALKAYTEAVKEHGKGSAEARQAEIDLAQANSDLKQANLDAEQATRDASQAQIDQKQAVTDSKQATIDAKDAQLNLNDAMSEAHPSDLSKFNDQVQMVAPILSGLAGIVGLVTAAQWAWNAAQLASPTTWIILAIIALIAIIVVIATKTEWFQKAWRASWNAIKAAAGAVGRWFKDVLWGQWIQGAWNAIMAGGRRVWAWLSSIPRNLINSFKILASALTAPFRAAFGAIKSIWNNTVGRISFSIPGWIPGIGGNSWSMPKFHSGGTVPGAPGSEVVAVLQAGEKVTPVNGNSSQDEGGWVKIQGDKFIDDLTAAIASRVGAKGGRGAMLGIKVV